MMTPGDSWMKRGLHRAVGKDGVLMISLPRDKQKADECKAKLSEVQVYPRIFFGTDYRDPGMTIHKFEKAWNISLYPHVNSKPLDSYATRFMSWTASVADSHRRALEEAQGRPEKWTAILEDDVVPILAKGMKPHRWIESFESAWHQIPSSARIVRLGYCNDPGQEERMERLPNSYAGDFMITKYTQGFCTTGYIIRKDAIPELLSSFPCKDQLDLCWYRKLSELSAVNMELKFDVPEMVFEDPIINATIQQYGIVRQDWHTLPAHYSNGSFFASFADAFTRLSPHSLFLG